MAYSITRSFTKLNSTMVLEGSSVLTNLALWICRHAYWYVTIKHLGNQSQQHNNINHHLVLYGLKVVTLDYNKKQKGSGIPLWGYPIISAIGGNDGCIRLQRWIITCDVFLTLHGGNMPGGVKNLLE